MSTTLPEDGGPAFPIFSDYAQAPGMKLRDYFAAAALQGRLARCDHNGWSWSDMARHSYEAADAMLAERSKTEEAEP